MIPLYFVSRLKYLWLIPIVFLIDIVSKIWVLQHLELYEQFQLCRYFSILHTHNYGMALGLLEDKNYWKIWLFSIVIILIMVTLLPAVYNNRVSSFVSISYTLIMGGGLGNYFDRVYYGFVIDFIDLHIGYWYFPTFNIADASISAGILLVLLDGLRLTTLSRAKL